MIYSALIFLVIGLIAGVLGFGSVAGATAGIAQLLFYFSLSVLIISLLVDALSRRT